MTYELTAGLILADAIVFYLWCIGAGLCTGMLWALFFAVIKFR